MKDENRNRMGDKFEREMADLFQRIGFVVKNHIFTTKEDGRKSEQDVLAICRNFKILIQCKDYAKFPFETIENIVDDLIEDGKSLKVDRMVLAITGHKSLPEEYRIKLKKKGVYLWNENYWRKLQNLDKEDLKKHIEKNLEFGEFFNKEKTKEREELNDLFSKINKIEDTKRKKLILENLKEVDFPDEFKREIQLKKIENEILLEKEKEATEQTESKVEDIELEELFSKINKSDLDFNKRYLILDKLRNEIELSKKSGKIIDVEKIKTFIERQEENLEDEKWGDTKIDDLGELRDKGEISQEDYENLRGKVKGMGVSKKGLVNAERKSFEYELKKSKFLIKKRKFFKIFKISSILIISLVLIIFIFSLFNNPIENQIIINNTNNLTNNSETSKVVIQSNQDFLDFCKTKFNEASQNSKLYDYKYFDNYNDAKNWIYNLFPEEIEINRNRAKFFTEWYLDKAEFPIYVLQGSMSNSPSLVENGYYVCDINGIIKREVINS